MLFVSQETYRLSNGDCRLYQKVALKNPKGFTNKLTVWCKIKNCKYLVPPMLAVLGTAMVLSSFATSFAFAQDTRYEEEYMAQHDGGDRDEYLQEMEHSDPEFYV
jgi:hypothetical protein